mmetsp:Transcript_12230/g.22622  ORF Transcript_12230/g.22622 Transcript_12230/m.22622 type:complete len:234 (-) Transcript_12230:222-923(-)
MAACQTARAVCKCGTVEIALLSGVAPYKRLECCCYDCHDALAYAQKRGGPPVKTRHQDLIYFPNDLKVLRGMEQVGFYKMREGYPTTRLYAKCCWTVLLGDHPSYKGKIVVTYGTEDAGGVVCGAEVPDPLARIYTKDLSDEEQEAMPSFHDTSMVFRCDDADVLRYRESQPPLPEPTTLGTTVQALMRQLGWWIPGDIDTRGVPRTLQGNAGLVEASKSSDGQGKATKRPSL